MDFYEVVAQVVDLLHQQGRVTYRGLQLQFKLDDEMLEALKEEILYAQPQVIDDAGKGLMRTGNRAASESDVRPAAEAETQFYTVLRTVTVLLRQERRVNLS